MADINLTAEQVAALILSIGDKSKLKTADKQTIVDAINEVIDSNLAPSSVLYTPMNLSDESKVQARENIDAEISEYKIPLLYDSVSGKWSTEISPKDLSHAYRSGKRISAFVNLSPTPTREIHRIFQLKTIQSNRRIITGSFVSADTANITKLTLTPTQNNTAFVISEEITPILVPLYIKGTYDTQAKTFTPDTDYTVQEISDAVSAGRYVALVVGGEYIVPCVECTSLYCIFSLLQISDILNITDEYINIRISRRSGGWNVGAWQTT